MPRRNNPNKRPTWTRLVVDSLSVMDEPLTVTDLCDLTGGTANQVAAACSWLQRADVLGTIEGNGKLWFYLTGKDNRTRSHDERTPEDKPRKARQRKVPHDPQG